VCEQDLKDIIGAVDRRNKALLFESKGMVFGARGGRGEFRQVLPIKPKGS
jgi:hypothetical protein